MRQAGDHHNVCPHRGSGSLCRWPLGSLAGIAVGQLLQASLLEEGLGGGMQRLQDPRHGFAWVQEEVEAGAVGGVIGWLQGCLTFSRPGKWERQGEVLGQHPDGQVIILAKFLVGPLDAVEMLLPLLGVSIIDVWEGPWQGLDQH